MKFGKVRKYGKFLNGFKMVKIEKFVKIKNVNKCNLRLSNGLRFDIRQLIFHIFKDFFAFHMDCLPMSPQKTWQIRRKFTLPTLELKMGFMDFDQMFNQIHIRRERLFAMTTLFVTFLRLNTHLDNFDREILQNSLFFALEKIASKT